MLNINAVYLFITLAGFVIGLGAVTVIDTLGFFARKSTYFTQATIRAHKITKPLIWMGTLLMFIGGNLYYISTGELETAKLHLFVSLVLIANGMYLSFVISPYLLKLEKQGKSNKLLSKNIQNRITVSFIISFTGWWFLLLLLVTTIHGFIYIP